MSKLRSLSLCDVQKDLRKKEFSALELVDAYLERADSAKSLNGYITVCPEVARDQAKKSDERIQRGEARPLEGIPFGIKDNFCTKDILSTAGSRILYNFIPQYESTITRKLLDAGVTFIGKCNMDEFACGGTNTHSAYGPAINPWSKEGDPRIPGGSSGGSAVVVAAGQALGSVGSDTGGSVRQPAAYCGLVGLKPTYGRCSRFGLMSMGCSLDQPGPIGRTIEDVAQVFQVMAGYDSKDARSVDTPVQDYSKDLGESVRGMRVGIPLEFPLKDLDPVVAGLWQEKQKVLQEAGCTVVPVSLPRIRDGLTCYYILVPAEVSSNMSRYDGIRYGLRSGKESLDELYRSSRGEGFGLEVKKRILMGNYILSQGYADKYYRNAQMIRCCIRAEFHSVFQKVDMLFYPTTPNTAGPLHAKDVDPLDEYYADIFTIPASLAGLPGLSVPVGSGADGLPLGFQLVGRHFEENRLLQLGHVLEKSTVMDSLPLYRSFESSLFSVQDKE